MNRNAVFWLVVSGQLPLPPAADTLGWQFVQYDEGSGEIHVSYTAEEALTNPLGNIQGGILSAMLDDCMGPAIYATLPPNKIAVTVESKTLFIRPAVPGKIFGTGKIEHLKGNLCFTSGQLRDIEGRVLATATAIFRIGKLRWNGLIVPSAVAGGMLKWKLRKYKKE
ncbi:PaaI family thioesterase [Serratia ureilytica]|uniref:PaaI family thioesterase n=1 Tax=Serratia ureilytica TaxID=300181 RepID=UPI00313AD629